MKDYESYNNKGNKDIPDNPRLKKLDVYPHYQDTNELPGEYFDIRENALDCDLDDDDKYAYDANEHGSADTKNLDDIQDLTNVVNPSVTSATTGSIVESAGIAVTGTATVVVGAAAAVVAFNATNKVLPTMTVNTLDSGSSFVHYNLEINNLDLSKDYDIVIRNSQQEFKLDCTNGVNDEYVYNLKPGLEYSLTLVGYDELLGEIPYVSKKFFTLNSEEVLGYSNIEVIYNDDLTCGIKYDTTMVDDFNTIGDTYIIVKELVKDQGGEEWDLFDSLYAEDFMREEPDKYTYSYSNKVHKGSISEVPPGLIIIELYKIGPEGEEWNGELIASTEKEVVYPIYEKSDSNYIEFDGDYNLIKDIKKINIKKDNLVAKITLYNEDDEETFIEKEIDITEGLFDYKQLVKQDTAGYSYQIGYYKADKSFVVIKEKAKEEFYGGYYGAYYDDVYSNYEQMKADWNYDEAGNETLDLTLLTDFDNYGNDDCYYKVELYRNEHGDQGLDTLILIDTYTGTGLPTFKNLPTREYHELDDYYTPIYYSFKYTSYMNYYDGENGKNVVEMEVRDHTDWSIDFAQQFGISDTQFSIRGDGKYYIPLEANMETSYASQLDYKEGNLTLYFFRNVDEILETIETRARIEKTSSDLMIVFSADLPNDMAGYKITCDIPYYGMFSEDSSARRLVIKEPFLMGDIHYSLMASKTKYTIADGVATGSVDAFAYIPKNGYVAVTYDNAEGEYYRLNEVDGKYTYTFTELLGSQYLRFVVFDENDYQVTETSLYISNYPQTEINTGKVEMHNTDGNYYSVMTYNDDGTVNIYCITGLYQNPLYVESAYGKTSYRMDCYLQVYNNNTGEYVDVASIKDITEDQPIAVFNNVPYVKGDATYNIRYDLTYDYFDEYGKCQDIITGKICEFQLVESNIGSLHPDGQLVGYVSYNEDLGQDVINLTIPAGMMYDKNQTVRLEEYVNPEDDKTIYTINLGDYLTSSSDDGDYYIIHDVDISIIAGGTIDLFMMYNYTLTEEKYNMIKDIYKGNLYREYSILVTHV